MFIPSTLRPYEAWMPMIVLTHSLRTEFPGFLEVSVLVAIWAKMSLISSEALEFLAPRILRT
jgi:hypothetical protein